MDRTQSKKFYKELTFFSFVCVSAEDISISKLRCTSVVDIYFYVCVL